MKKALLSLGIVGILVLGTNNVFAAPMPPNHGGNQPRIAAAQPNRGNIMPQQRHNIAPAPRHKVAPPQPKHIAKHHNNRYIAQQPYYRGYNQGFTLKIGNFFLSI